MLLQRNSFQFGLQDVRIVLLAIGKMLCGRSLNLAFFFKKKSHCQFRSTVFCVIVVPILPLSAYAQSTIFVERSDSVSAQESGIPARNSNDIGRQVASAQSVRRVLDWLDIESSVLQIDRVIRRNSQHYSLNLSAQEAEKLGQLLQLHADSQSVLKVVHAKIGVELATKVEGVERLLAASLPVRVRNFDVAMSMPGAKEKFRVYRKNLQKKHPSAARLDLVKRLDTALKTSAIVALIQTEINVTAQLLCSEISNKAEPFLPPSVVDYQRQQRMTYIGKLSSDLHLFSYRFLKDEELGNYVELLEQPSIQLVLESAYQSIGQRLIQGRENILAVD